LSSRRKGARRGALTALVLLAVPGTGLGGDKLPMARHLAVPDHVTADTRAQLAGRMTRHADVMSNLVRAVVLLDRPTIRVLASRIADEEVIAQGDRTTPDRPPLNVPAEFLGEQTALATAARQLAAAAVDRGDDQLLAQRFAEVTTTCVGCHSVYLHGRPDPRPLGPPEK
jgi:cytochrome c553